MIDREGPSLVIRREKRPRFSMRLEVKAITVSVILVIAVTATFVVYVASGSLEIGLGDVLRTVFGGGAGPETFAIREVRLPRALTAGLVGASLAVAGAILQGIARNPLADPGIIGVTGGAGVVAVITIVVYPGVSVAVMPPLVFGGAVAAAALVYLLSWKRGSSGARLVLVGIGIAAAAQAFITVILAVGNIIFAHNALVWLTGSVFGRTWEHVSVVAPWVVVLIPVAWIAARHLDSLTSGDDVAGGLGVRIELTRLSLIGVAVGLAAASVVGAGTVAFVGLMAPHAARLMVGPKHVALIPASALTGALILLLADLIGRNLFAPFQIPAGVVTAAVGAPYFLFLLRRVKDV